LREERRLRVFENRVLRRVFGPRRDEVTEEWKKLNNLGRLRRRWEDDIKMHLQEVGCKGMDWIELAQVTERWRTLVNAVMNLRVP
jgi:hypothetical protein